MENPVIKSVERHIFTRVPVDNLTEDQALEVFQQMAADGRYHRIFLLTYKNYRKARRDEHFMRELQEASLVIPVSRSLAWGMGFLRLPKPTLYYPFDFVIKLLGALEEKGKSAYFLGGRHEEIQKIAQVIKASFPKMRLVGRHVGYYPKDQEPTVITAIQKSGPTALVVGPGLPGRFRWAAKNASRLPVPITIWSDLTFHIMSGKKQRPKREVLAKGNHETRGLWYKPWKWLRVHSYISYFFVLVWYKLRKIS